jgi:branched-chain amino acid transport system permease protein
MASIVALCVVPFFLDPYRLGVVTVLLIHLILAVSFRLILTTGGWNFAHFVLWGCGAYFSAIMVKDFGWPFWAALSLAGPVAALVGLALSYPLSKMRLFAFFIASYTMGEAIRLTWIKLDYPFGGPGGITNIPRPSPLLIPGLLTINFRQGVPYYFLVMGVMLVSLFIMYRVDRSQLGDIFKAIYSQDILTENIGISVTTYKRLNFVIGSFFAGVAGALMAHYFKAIDPSYFALGPLIILLIWVVVGGTETFFGPIIGTVSFTGLEEALRPLAAWRPLVYGVILIVVLRFMPGGFESLLAMISPRIKRLRRRT